MLAEYYNGTTEQQANDIHALNPFLPWGESWAPVANRAGLVEDVFTEGEISNVGEQTQAAYVRVDFGFDTAMPIEGNIGVRYVETTNRISSRRTVHVASDGRGPDGRGSL